MQTQFYFAILSYHALVNETLQAYREIGGLSPGFSYEISMQKVLVFTDNSLTQRKR